MSGDCLRKTSRTVGAVRERRIRETELRTTIPSSLLRVWFSAPPGLALPLGSLPDNWRNELLNRAGDIERHQEPKRASSSRGREVLVQDVLPTTAQRYDGAVAEFENICESETSMGSRGSPITVSTKWVCVQHLRTCFASGTLGPRLAGTLISDLRRYVLLARTCGADLEDHQAVFPTLCALNLVPCCPNRIQNTSISRVWQCPPGSKKSQNFLSFLSFLCLLRTAEARQLRWRDVKMFDGSLLTRYEKCMTSFTSKNPKRAEGQDMQPTNMCIWTVLESFTRSTQ